MKYYVAYGSNLNKAQMWFRCPDAKPVGKTVLRDRKLVFNGVATVVKEKGASVPVGLWLISDSDERNLDIYEGFPRLYRKEYLTLKIKYKGQKTKTEKALIYVMNEGRRKQAPPSEMYYRTIREGYEDFGIGSEPLEQARKKSYENS